MGFFNKKISLPTLWGKNKKDGVSNSQAEAQEDTQDLSENINEGIHEVLEEAGSEHELETIKEFGLNNQYTAHVQKYESDLRRYVASLDAIPREHKEAVVRATVNSAWFKLLMDKTRTEQHNHVEGSLIENKIQEFLTPYSRSAWKQKFELSMDYKKDVTFVSEYLRNSGIDHFIQTYSEQLSRMYNEVINIWNYAFYNILPERNLLSRISKNMPFNPTLKESTVSTDSVVGTFNPLPIPPADRSDTSSNIEPSHKSSPDFDLTNRLTDFSQNKDNLEAAAELFSTYRDGTQYIYGNSFFGNPILFLNALIDEYGNTIADNIEDIIVKSKLQRGSTTMRGMNENDFIEMVEKTKRAMHMEARMPVIKYIQDSKEAIFEIDELQDSLDQEFDVANKKRTLRSIIETRLKPDMMINEAKEGEFDAYFAELQAIRDMLETGSNTKKLSDENEDTVLTKEEKKELVYQEGLNLHNSESEKTPQAISNAVLEVLSANEDKVYQMYLTLNFASLDEIARGVLSKLTDEIARGELSESTIVQLEEYAEEDLYNLIVLSLYAIRLAIESKFYAKANNMKLPDHKLNLLEDTFPLSEEEWIELLVSEKILKQMLDALAQMERTDKEELAEMKMLVTLIELDAKKEPTNESLTQSDDNSKGDPESAAPSPEEVQTPALDEAATDKDKTLIYLQLFDLLTPDLIYQLAEEGVNNIMEARDLSETTKGILRMLKLDVVLMLYTAKVHVYEIISDENSGIDKGEYPIIKLDSTIKDAERSLSAKKIFEEWISNYIKSDLWVSNVAGEADFEDKITKIEEYFGIEPMKTPNDVEGSALSALTPSEKPEELSEEQKQQWLELAKDIRIWKENYKGFYESNKEYFDTAKATTLKVWLRSQTEEQAKVFDHAYKFFLATNADDETVANKFKDLFFKAEDTLRSKTTTGDDLIFQHRRLFELSVAEFDRINAPFEEKVKREHIKGILLKFGESENFQKLVEKLDKLRSEALIERIFGSANMAWEKTIADVFLNEDKKFDFVKGSEELANKFTSVQLKKLKLQIANFVGSFEIELDGVKDLQAEIINLSEHKDKISKDELELSYSVADPSFSVTMEELLSGDHDLITLYIYERVGLTDLFRKDIGVTTKLVAKASIAPTQVLPKNINTQVLADNLDAEYQNALENLRAENERTRREYEAIIANLKANGGSTESEPALTINDYLLPSEKVVEEKDSSPSKYSNLYEIQGKLSPTQRKEKEAREKLEEENRKQQELEDARKDAEKYKGIQLEDGNVATSIRDLRAIQRKRKEIAEQLKAEEERKANEEKAQDALNKKKKQDEDNINRLISWLDEGSK